MRAVWMLFGTSCDKELLLLRIFLPTAVAIPPRQDKNPSIHTVDGKNTTNILLMDAK